MTDTRQFNVAVVGAAGGIGQPLSLLMKMNPMVGRLSLYDVMGSPGVAADLGHICTGATVSGHLGDDVGAALQGCDLVIIPAGVPRKPGMTRDDLFRVNAGIVAGLARSCAEHCPEACVLVISNPVNALVPIFAAELEKAGVFDPRRLLGVTTLDLVRARTFVAEAKGVPAADVRVPVVGGHSGGTIVPLLSQCGHQFTQEEVEKLTHRIQFGGDEVVQAKAGTGSATLSMAFAGAELASSVMKGLSGETVTDYAYVQRQEGSSVPTEYFATQVTLGRGGVQAACDVHNDANEYEKELLEKAAEGLRASIQQAREFVEAAQS